MRGSSRAALAASRESLDGITSDPSVDLSQVGDDLFAAMSLLDREPALRRSLSDPAKSGDAKAELVRALVGNQIQPASLSVVQAAVRGRWASGSDLADALERLGVEATVAAAEREGRLDDLEDQLFRFVRIVDATPPLRQALSDRIAPRASKVELIESLLGGRATAATRRLVVQAATAPRGRTIEKVLLDYGQVAADHRDRLVAHVRVARTLDEEQRRRLGAALTRIYGHDVHLDVDVDPRVIGGIEVTIGGELVDGTIVSRLDEARRRLTG